MKQVEQQYILITYTNLSCKVTWRKRIHHKVVISLIRYLQIVNISWFTLLTLSVNNSPVDLSWKLQLNECFNRNRSLLLFINFNVQYFFNWQIYLISIRYAFDLLSMLPLNVILEHFKWVYKRSITRWYKAFSNNFTWLCV